MSNAITWRSLLPLLAALVSFSTLADTRQIEDAMGNRITVPAQPQRIVTLGEVDLDVTLALGLTPIGTTDGRGQAGPPRYLQQHLTEKTPSLGLLNTPNLETLLELEPDLILIGPSTSEQLAILNEIAPTAVSYTQGEPWRDATLRVAHILNRQTEGQQLLERYEERAAQVRERLKAHQGESISIVRWNPKGPSFMLRDSFASTIAQDVGLVRPAQQQEPGPTHSMPLSLESLDVLDADWLVIGTLAPEGEAVDALHQAEQTPMYRQLEAIQSGRYAAVDGSVWTSAFGPLAAQQVIEDLEKLILGEN